MFGLGAIGQFAIGEQTLTTPIAPPLDWFQPLSQPVRMATKPLAVTTQAFFFDSLPIVPRDWFVPLSEPAYRTRQGLKAGQQTAFFMQPAPSPFVATGWFMPLSEPVRRLQGLDAARQQFLAAPSRLLPTPTTFGVLSATETGDRFQGGARSWNRVVSGEVGAIEQAFTGAQVAAVEMAASAGASGAIETTAAPSVGAAVPVITKASVAIIIR